MTVTNVQRLRSAARPLTLRASLAGLVVGVCAALASTAWAAPATPVPAMAQAGVTVAVDPARTVPAAVSVSSIDFKRGDGGAGRLILHFSGDGAAPDLRTQGSAYAGKNGASIAVLQVKDSGHQALGLPAAVAEYHTADTLAQGFLAGQIAPTVFFFDKNLKLVARRAGVTTPQDFLAYPAGH